MLHPQKSHVTTPARAAVRARRDLVRMARPSGSFDASRYFRGEVDLGFFNVGSGRVRAMAKEMYRRHRDAWSVDAALACADALMRDRYLEVKGAGVELMACYRRAWQPRILSCWKRWLARGYSANWATTDAICGMLIGPLLVQRPSLASEMRRWARHRNMWVRRASAVSLIPSVRRGLALDLAYRVARMLHPDPEDLIQKAVGWMLREAGKADARRLERYLRANGPGIPRTTLRYAIERFPPAKRRALLKITKSARGHAREARGGHRGATAGEQMRERQPDGR
jgi:3-methyladenine DNA glycosylase AlkD